MILVVGATGRLGGMIARRLLDQKKTVRVLVRPSSDYRALVNQGAEPVEGDLKDRASLDRACKGVETLITTANSAARGGEDNPDTVDDQGNRNLIDAAKAAGVKQFIFISALGADPSSPIPLMAGKGKAEQHLRASGLTYTIFEPNLFMEIWLPSIVAAPCQAGQPVTIVGQGHRKHSFISMEDVAAFAVAAVDHPAAQDKLLIIGGPQAHSWRDVVAIYERILGRPVSINALQPGQPSPLPPFVAGLMAAMDNYDSAIDMTEVVRTFGVKQTAVEEFARRTVPAPATT